MTKVRTNDGEIFELPAGLVDECEVLKSLCDMTDDNFIPLPNIDSEIMETVIRFFESNSLPEFTDIRQLFPVLLAADYLGYETLLEKGSQVSAESLKGLPTKECRNICGLEEPNV